MKTAIILPGKTKKLRGRNESTTEATVIFKENPNGDDSRHYGFSLTIKHNPAPGWDFKTLLKEAIEEKIREEVQTIYAVNI